MKALKYALAGVAGVILVLALAAAYWAFTFDANAYKPHIAALVKEKTQRALTLEGDIELSFWPDIGARFGRMSLSEPRSDRQFASIESGRVSLKLLPLLSRTLVIDELTLKGLRTSIVRAKAGETNIDDLIGEKTKAPAETQQPLRFDIAHVAIENADIDYRDEARGAHYRLAGLDIETGRLAPDVPTTIRIGTAIAGDAPKIDAAVAGKGRLTFNLERQAYDLDDFTLDIEGSALGYTHVAARATGSLAVNLERGELATDRLAVNGSGLRGKDKLEFRLDAPKLAMRAEKASAEKIAVAVTMTTPDGVTQLALTLPGMEGHAKSFRVSTMTVDIDRKHPMETVKARLTSPVAGNLEAKQIHLPGLRATLTMSGQRFAGQSLAGSLEGSASIDIARARGTADVAGRIADSTLRTRLAVTGFLAPALSFDVDIDRLDVDRYRQPSRPAKKPGTDGRAPAETTQEAPIDLSALRGFRAQGSVRVGSLKAFNVETSHARADLKADRGRLELNPIGARLYRGALAGGVIVDASQAMPAFSVRQTLTGVAVGPLLRALDVTDALEGNGNVSLNVTARGNTVAALKKALDGSASVKLTDGAIKGIDLAAAIRKAQNIAGALKGQEIRRADATQRTDFSELTATFDIRNGVARNSDLAVKSPFLRIGGAGAIDIGGDAIDYTMKATVVASLEGQGGRERSELRGLTVPVRISGPIAAPSYALDFGGMATEAAKRKIEEEISRRLGERLGASPGKEAARPGEGPRGHRGLEESLRGLFGR